MLDAERELIRHYTNTDSLREMIEGGLREEHFFNSQHQEIFSFVMEYFQQSKMTSAPTRKVLEDKFQQYFLNEGWPDDEDSPSVYYCISEVRKTFKSLTGQKLIKSLNKDLVNDPDNALPALVEGLAKAQILGATGNRTEIWAEKVQERIAAYHEQVVNPSLGRGLFLGWPEIDQHTFGVMKGEIGTIAGFTNVGKSWCADWIALQAAMPQRFTQVRNGVTTEIEIPPARVYLVTMENDLAMTLKRLDCLYSGIPYSRYERGELTPDEQIALEEAAEKIKGMDNLIVDYPRERHERTLIDVYTRAKFFNADLFVGDQISWVFNPDHFREKREEITDTIQEVKALSASIGLASIWAVQLNRESQKSKTKRGELYHLAQSSGLEQTCDFVFILSQDDDQANERKALFTVKKTRRSKNDAAWLINWQFDERTHVAVDRTWGGDALDVHPRAVMEQLRNEQ